MRTPALGLWVSSLGLEVGEPRVCPGQRNDPTLVACGSLSQKPSKRDPLGAKDEKETFDTMVTLVDAIHHGSGY